MVEHNSLVYLNNKKSPLFICMSGSSKLRERKAKKRGGIKPHHRLSNRTARRKSRRSINPAHRTLKNKLKGGDSVTLSNAVATISQEVSGMQVSAKNVVTRPALEKQRRAILAKQTQLEGLRGSIASEAKTGIIKHCLLYTSPSPRDVEESRMPSSA